MASPGRFPPEGAFAEQCFGAAKEKLVIASFGWLADCPTSATGAMQGSSTLTSNISQLSVRRRLFPTQATAAEVVETLTRKPPKSKLLSKGLRLYLDFPPG